MWLFIGCCWVHTVTVFSLRASPEHYPPHKYTWTYTAKVIPCVLLYHWRVNTTLHTPTSPGQDSYWTMEYYVAAYTTHTHNIHRLWSICTVHITIFRKHSLISCEHRSSEIFPNSNFKPPHLLVYSVPEKHLFGLLFKEFFTVQYAGTEKSLVTPFQVLIQYMQCCGSGTN